MYRNEIISLSTLSSHIDVFQIDIEIVARKNFAAGVLRGKNELKLKDPTHTQVNGLIETSVVEVTMKFVVGA